LLHPRLRVSPVKALSRLSETVPHQLSWLTAGIQSWFRW